MASDRKKASLAKRLARYARNAFISGIKGIYHDAKNNAKSKHDVDMDLKNIYKTSIKNVLLENKKESDEDRLDMNEIKSLIEKAKKSALDALDTTYSSSELQDRLMGMDFDDVEMDFEDSEELGTEDIDDLVKPAVDVAGSLLNDRVRVDEEKETILRKDKSYMVSLAWLFAYSYIQDDEFKEFLMDKKESIYNFLSGNGIDIDGPVDKIPSNKPEEIKSSFDRVTDTIDSIKNEPVVYDAKSGMTVVGTMEDNFDEEHTELRNNSITVAYRLNNILKDLNSNVAKDSDAESIYSTFVHYVHKIIDFYNTSKDIRSSADELIYQKCWQIKSLINHGFDPGSALHIFAIFLLDLISEDVKRSISDILINAINFKKED